MDGPFLLLIYRNLFFLLPELLRNTLKVASQSIVDFREVFPLYFTFTIYYILSWDINLFLFRHFEELPTVLTIHLKRFIYDESAGCQKLLKDIEFPEDLKIPWDFLSNFNKYGGKQPTYRLFGVSLHDNLHLKSLL